MCRISSLFFLLWLKGSMLRNANGGQAVNDEEQNRTVLYSGYHAKRIRAPCGQNVQFHDVTEVGTCIKNGLSRFNSADRMYNIHIKKQN